MFAVSTIYWISSVVVTFLVITDWFSNADPNKLNSPSWLTMFSAILLINVSILHTPHHLERASRLRCPDFDQYILTDGVVVWRAWVLCADQSRVILMVPVVTLTVNSCALPSFPGSIPASSHLSSPLPNEMF
jgi:hypothetical protein